MVVQTSDNCSLCQVKDAKQYQMYLAGKKTRETSKLKKSKGKAKAVPPLTDNATMPDPSHQSQQSPSNSVRKADDTDNTQSDILEVDLHSLVTLSPEDQVWAMMDETNVDFRDEVEATKWKTACENQAAHEAGLTWHEKRLADLEGMLCPVHKTTLSRTLLGDALPMPLCCDFL